MVPKKDFEVGDLVWSKMKGYPYWPSKIVTPPADTKPGTSKKACHYVLFFGTENFAFIPDINIVHHSEERLQEASAKKKSADTFKLAVEKITEEAKKHRSSVREKECPIKSSKASKIVRKIIKVQKAKTKSSKVQKKPPQKRLFDELTNKLPPRKLKIKSEDNSELISKTPPNVSYNRVTVIVPKDDNANSFGSPAINGHDYVEFQPYPSLNLQEKSAAIQVKNFRPTDKKIGFIGLGMMGQRLVKNLISSGHKVTIWNRTPSKCVDFVEVGAQQAQTPCDVVEKCDIIFCCVSGPDASKSVVFGDWGVLQGLEKSSPCSKGYVEMSTIDPVTSQENAKAITHKGGRYLEAPIIGSRQMAEDGNLVILGAGDSLLFANCETCFFALSKKACHLSCDVGSGAKMNLILSMLMGISHASLAEAMTLVVRNRLSRTSFLKILEYAPLNSLLFSEKGQAMQNQCFVTNNSLKYQVKDLNLALALGKDCEQPMSLPAAANELFKEANLRYFDHDVSAVYMGARF